MQLLSFLSLLLFLNPVLSTPIPSRGLNCDSLLSFGEAGQHSVVSIRAFCNRRKHKPRVESVKGARSVEKRSVTSVFDLPAVRSEQQQRGPHVAVPHYIQEAKETLNPIDTTWSSPITAIDELELAVLPTSRGRDCQSPPFRKLSHDLARLRSFTMGELQRRTHGLLVAMHGMTGNLVIAGFVAVSFVMLVLLAAERWMGAQLRWTRYALPTSTSSFMVDVKIPAIIINETDEEACIL